MKLKRQEISNSGSKPEKRKYKKENDRNIQTNPKITSYQDSGWI